MRDYSSGIRTFVLMGVLFLAIFCVHAETAEEYFSQGIADSKKHLYGQAIVDFTKSIEINPNYANAYVNRGNVYNHKGEFTHALSDYNKAIEINPKDGDTYYNRGIVYFYQGDFTKAWDDVHKAQNLGAKVDPKFLEELKKASGKDK